MVLTAQMLALEIQKGNASNPIGISVVPEPDLNELATSGEASFGLRLGQWFMTMKQTNESSISLNPKANAKIGRMTKQYFIPFGQTFVVHPGRFVLAASLEWIRLPNCYAAIVVGKSSLGRRGIIIETAAGVHPGFSGCLTLEIANVGEIPVELISGMKIGQLFVHKLEGALGATKTGFANQRKPRLGEMRVDPVLESLLKVPRQ